MRDYIFTQAQSRLSTFRFASLRLVVGNWRARRKLLKLHELGDHQLNDIGLTRGQLQHLTGLPLSVDPVWEAERCRLVASHQKPERR